MIKNLIYLIRETFSEWSEDKASRLAAALSYYTMFSLAPLLVITIALLGIFLGEEAASGQIYRQIDNLIGPESAVAVQEMIERVGRQEDAGIIATVIGVAVLLFGAAGVFGQLYDSMNTIWEVYPITTRKGLGAVLEMAQRKLVSFTMVLGVGFLLLVSLIISAGLTALAEYSSGLLPLPPLVLQALNVVVSIGLITVLFAMLYKFVPEVKIGWKDALIGGLVTAILFTAGKQLIGLYLGRSTTASVFGAAGSIIVIMLWVYYSAQILFLGAEFTQVYAREFGGGVEVEDDAIAVPDITQIREEAIAARQAGTPIDARATTVAMTPVMRTKAPRQPSTAHEHLRPSVGFVVEKDDPQNIGPFAAVFLAFWTFVAGVFLGLVRRDKREKRA